MPPPDTFSPSSVVRAFMLRCESKNLAAGSIAWYRQILRALERHLRESFDLAEFGLVTPSHIRSHLQALKSRGQSSETIDRTFGALRCFFRFATREGLVGQNPMSLVERPRRERRLIQPLSAPQAAALLSQPDASGFIGTRDRLLMLLMLDSGLRISEALTLKLEGVDRAAGTVLVMGKGRKERKVPFAETTRAALGAYLAERGELQAAELIVSRRGSPLTSRHVQLALRRYGRSAGIQWVRVSPHTLRHTFAILYIRAGGDPFSLQAILGHQTLEMVRNYVNMASADVSEQHRKFSPMDRLLAANGAPAVSGPEGRAQAAPTRLAPPRRPGTSRHDRRAR